MRVIAPAVFLLLALVATARGEEETPEQAAGKVLAAVGKNDEADLAQLAGRDEPEPWRVAEALLARGERDAALAFARAAARPATEKLPAAIEAGRLDVDAALRMKLAEVLGHLEGKQPNEALALLDAVEGEPKGFAAVRLFSLRASALDSLRRLGESAAESVRAAQAAEAMGWLTDAGRCFYLAGRAGLRGARYADAIGAWKQSERVYRRLGDEKRIAASLAGRSLAHRLLSEFDEALALQREAVAIYEKRGDRAGKARVLGYMGSTHSLRGEFEKAEEFHLLSLKIFEELGLRRDIALTLGNLANALQTQGRLRESHKYRKLALRELEEIGTPRQIAVELGNLGSLEFALGDFLGALETFEDCLRRAVALGDRRQIACTRFNIGNARSMLDDSAGAVREYEAAIRDFRELGIRSWLATALRTYGERLEIIGDPEGAIAAIREAIEVARKIGNKREEVRARSGLARIAVNQGDYAEAWAQEEAAGELRGEAGRGSVRIHSLNTRAGLFSSVGDFERALPLCEQAVALARKIDRPLRLAYTLELMAHLREWVGDHAGALRDVNEARRIYEELDRDGPLATILIAESRILASQGKLEAALDRVRRAAGLVGKDAPWRQRQRVQAELGRLLVRTNRLEEARPHLLECLRISEEMNSAEGEIIARWNRATVELLSGDPEAALEEARQGVHKLKRYLRGLSERESVHAWDRWQGLFAVGVRSARKIGDVEAALFFLESGRAEGLVEMLGGRELLEPRLVSPELRAAEATARGAESIAFHRLKRAEREGKLKDVREARSALDAARSQVEGIVIRIQRETRSGGGAVDPIPVTTAEVRAGLRPGEALVLYLLDDKDATAIVVVREGARLVPLGPGRRVRELSKILSSVGPDSDHAAAARLLSDLIVAPLELPEDVTRLIVGPDRELALVPLSLIAPELEIAFVSSGTVLVTLRGQAVPAGEGVLALGAPDHGKGPADGLLAHRRNSALGALPGSREEARSVGDKVLLGADCSEASLAKALAERRRWRAVHFACHGVLNEHNPLLSALVLTPDAENDGYLTCLDLIRRPVPTDLAVLSACGTGRGRVFGGEGIQGLARAFVLAGATRVLCSLWDVDDEATRALMVKFYELWNPTSGNGLPAAKALRQAQAFVRGHEKWRRPYYWAAWVLWGLPD